MTAMRGVRAALAVAVAAYVVSLVPGVRAVTGSAIWDVVVYALVLLGAAAVCALRAARQRADRLAWACIGTGLACYAAGATLFYTYYVDLPEVPYPSISDGLWLLLYPLAIVGVGLLVRARMAGSAASMWLDGVVSGLGLVSLSAAVVFPRVTAGASGPVAAIVTNFAYPLLDLALVATVIGAMAALGAWRERIWQLLGGGFLAFAAADSWYLLQVAAGTYQAGSPVDAAYQLAALLVALAAAAPDAREARENEIRRTETRSFLIPGSFALTAVGVLVVGAWERTTTLGIALAVGALSAAWVRTALAVREVVRLSDSRRQARTDALTGLPNRRAFYELLDGIDARPDAETFSAAVVLVDLDRFKEINDALGHQLGDRVLVQVSERFAAHLPAGGTLARLGGDELAFFVPGLTPDGATALARDLLVTLHAPVALDEVSLHLDASIGITHVESTTGVSRALAEADLAMYRAKASRTGWQVYDDERDGDAWDRLATVEALRRALDDGGLSVEFQPIADHTQPVGVEALIRWTHPSRGRMAPDEFLPLAERAGLMPALTRTVLHLALDQATALRRAGWQIPVSVNFSASDLLDGNLIDHVAQALADRGLSGESLRIEITESLLVDSDGTSIEFLHDLRALGVDIAVDDYGTGYSCMAYLHDLPVTSLKIDRGFTDRILRDERTAVIVASTIDMAHRLGLTVVAEGVETGAQLDWLSAHACDLIQGYHIGRPMAPAQLHAWLESYSGTRRAVISTMPV